MINHFPIALAIAGEVIRTMRMRIMHQKNFLSVNIAISRKQLIKLYAINGMAFWNLFPTKGK